MSKYQIIKIENIEVALDLSIFQKTEELWFNATDVARAFGKEVRSWVRHQDTKDFFEALIRAYPHMLKNFKGVPEAPLELDLDRYSYIVKVTKGRYGGTLLHRLCAFEFGRWCSKDFAVAMDATLIEFTRK